MISFTADRIQLGAAIARAAQGLPSRPPQPVYAGMLFRCGKHSHGDWADVTASDGDVTFVADAGSSVHVAEEGWFILPGKVTTDIFRYLSGKEVSITFDGTTATIEAGRALYVFSAVEGEQYPVQADVTTKFLGSVDGAEFADLVRFVVPAASRSDSRPTLRTVALSLADDKLTMVATDSYRMALVSPQFHPVLREEEDPPEQVLVPSWVMERFARVCDEEVALGWDGARVVLGTQGVKVVARQISGKYLDWRKVIAKQEQADLEADASVLDLTRAVKAATLVAGETLGIQLEFSKDGHIHVRAKGNGSCDEMIGTTYCGDTVTFIIGPQMILDGLAGCDEEVIFRFSSNPLAPVFMEDGGFRYFMQPRANIEEPGDQPAQ